MQVHKFGGISLKDAACVQNVAQIIASQKGKLLVVASAMAHSTRAFEKLFRAYFKQQEYSSICLKIKEFHQNIVSNLFPDYHHPIYNFLEVLFRKLLQELQTAPSQNYTYEYDRLVCYGEILSSRILSDYLNLKGINNQWVDIREHLISEKIHKEAPLIWAVASEKINKRFNFQNMEVYVTQGFIAGTNEGVSTTLGKEGSDFTAASLAYFLNAESLSVWKDVEGIYNADPKQFAEAEKIAEMSYKDAIELAYYGAKVIHPKTIKPIQNKAIPLYIRSFEKPEGDFTLIHSAVKKQKYQPFYILKTNQILISISPKDFSFIAEKNLSHIFALLARFRIKVNLTQNSAISFSIVVDDNQLKIRPLLNELKKKYQVFYNLNIKLITIRHYTAAAIEKMIAQQKIYVEQRSRDTARFAITQGN